MELDGNDDGGDIEVDEVYDEEWDGGQARNPPLVAPADVEEVIADAEESECLERDDCAKV